MLLFRITREEREHRLFPCCFGAGHKRGVGSKLRPRYVRHEDAPLKELSPRSGASVGRVGVLDEHGVILRQNSERHGTRPALRR